MLWIWLLLVIPLGTALGAWLLPRKKAAERLHLSGASLLFACGTAVLVHVMVRGPVSGLRDVVYVDALSAFLIFILVFVALTATVYAVGYFRFELEKGGITPVQLHRYYLWFHLFVMAMITVMILNHLALLWIAIELTTLISALLVAFYRKARALEAAWKYLIIGSLGIAFALFGILFLYASGLEVLGDTPGALNWTVLHAAAGRLDPTWITIAFVFVLVGFGTKAGLAPLHFWLPDAHSEAPSPVSAILSGVLLNTALYGILRVYLIANATLAGGANKWLLGFGLFSIALMVPFILVQHDVKRMLAYSSVEHMGIIALGVGIGGPLGLYGAMLHMFNHAMAKSLLFMSAGNMNQKYHSKRIDRITGLLKVMPVTGTAFMLGILAIAGAPPFNIFISELTIMLAGFKEGQIGMTSLFIVFVLLIFAGMTYYMSKMVFGRSKTAVEPGEISRWSTAALFIPLAVIPVFGLYVPPFLDDTLNTIVALFQGG